MLVAVILAEYVPVQSKSAERGENGCPRIAVGKSRHLS